MKNINLDKEGYLLDLSAWSTYVAEEIAQKEGIKLTDSHWEIIFLLRDFYEEYELSPAMRPLVKSRSKKAWGR